jgi:hypothetical protein
MSTWPSSESAYAESCGGPWPAPGGQARRLSDWRTRQRRKGLIPRHQEGGWKTSIDTICTACLSDQVRPVSLRPDRIGVVDGCDREDLADAAEDAAHLVAGCRGDAEHVEAAVN